MDFSTPTSRSGFIAPRLRTFVIGGAVTVLTFFAAGVLSGCNPTQAQAGPPMAPPVSVAPAVQRSVPQSDEFTGRLDATETVDIRARVGGTLDKVHFTEGQKVSKGQLLFSLDARSYWAELSRAKAQLTAARTAAELAGTESARADKLLAERAISQQEAEQLGAGARNAKANVLAAEAAVQVATLNIEYSQIRAPITGVVSRAQVTAGNLVAPGEQVLTTLVSQDKVYAYFDVPEQTYLRYARAGGDRKLPVNMGLADETGYPHAGQIDFFDNRLNPATGGIRARAVFDNTQARLIPGLFARIKLTSGTLGEAVLVPERAVGTDQSKRFVWVVGDDKMPQFRPVVLGSLSDGMRVVTQGLKPGEHVVVSGLQRVRPGMPLSPEVLAVDEQGRPIEPPPAPPGGAPAAPAKAAAPAAASAPKP